MPFEIDSEGARAEHQAPPEDPGAQTANSTERKDGWKDFIESAKAREFYQSNVKSLSAEETDELMCDILHSIDLDCETNGSVFSDDRRHLRRLLLKLARDKNHLPSSITLDGIIRDTATQDRGGSYADILCAKYGNQQVALKRMRGFHTASVKKTKLFIKEALIWRQLRHPYIQPFLGICDTMGQDICLVSPWMTNDSVSKYMTTLKERGDPIPCTKWIHEVALGLKYLKSQDIVHGDLRGANILVDSNQQILLTDFGLLWLSDVSLATQGTYNPGSTRWMAPEVLNGHRSTHQSDVYSFACVCVEMLTAAPPFAALKHTAQVVTAVVSGKVPDWPSSNHGAPERLKTIVASCWSPETEVRPTIEDLCPRIEKVFQEEGVHVARERVPCVTEPFTDAWDEPLSASPADGLNIDQAPAPASTTVIRHLGPQDGGSEHEKFEPPPAPVKNPSKTKTQRSGFKWGKLSVPGRLLNRKRNQAE